MLKIFWLIIFGLALMPSIAYSNDKQVVLETEALQKMHDLNQKAEMQLEQSINHLELLKSIQFYDTLIAYSQKNYGPLKELQNLKYITQSKQYNAIDDTSVFLMINGMLISQFPQEKKDRFIALFQQERDKLKKQYSEVEVAIKTWILVSSATIHS